jgi:DNA-binding NarL/FixJ family response regulator
MSSSPRVVLGEQATLTRGLHHRTCARYGLPVVGEAGEATDLVALCESEQPDVVLVSGVLAAADLDDILDRMLATGARVVVVSDDPSPERVTQLMSRGVSGFLEHDISPQQLAEALHSVARGEAVLHPRAAGTIVEQWRTLRAAHGPAGRAPRAALTRREHDVLVAMTEGMSGKAIARHLGVALKTVENHKIRIFDKLGVRTQAHAVSVAIGQGLIGSGAGAPRVDA